MDQINEMTALSIRHLSKKLSGRQILTDISFDIYPGEIFGFVGPNGSGKTTTIKLILGLLNIDAGEISIYGHNVKTDFREAMASVGGIIENPEMYKHLTGRQNLMQYCRMYDNIPNSRIEEVTKYVGLENRIDEKISKYSLGMRQRLGIAQAIVHSPKLLILDEPTNGLDPQGIHDLRTTLKRLATEEGVAVFISSHLLLEISAICDKIGIIDHGMLIALKTMEEIRRNSESKVNTYIVITSDTEKAINVIRSLIESSGTPSVGEKTDDKAEDRKIEYSVNEGKLSVTMTEDKLSSLIKALALADVPITGVTPVETTLEDEFLKITGKYVPGGKRQ